MRTAARPLRLYVAVWSASHRRMASAVTPIKRETLKSVTAGVATGIEAEAHADADAPISPDAVGAGSAAVATPAKGKIGKRSTRVEITPDYLKAEATVMHPKVLALREAYEQGRLTGPELAGLYVVAYLQHRYPGRWLTIPAKEPYCPAVDDRLMCVYDLPEQVLSFTPNIRKRLPPRPTVRTLFDGGLYTVPSAATWAMSRWIRNELPLDLLLYMPSAQEVFEMQCRGRRCVSVLTDRHFLESTIDGRDMPEFTLHDLVHGHRFFHSPVLRDSQLGFLRAMRSVVDSGLFRRYLDADREFQAEFDYLIADMNAASMHLVMYLKAKIIYCLRRLEQRERGSQLAETRAAAVGAVAAAAAVVAAEPVVAPAAPTAADETAFVPPVVLTDDPVVAEVERIMDQLVDAWRGDADVRAYVHALCRPGVIPRALGQAVDALFTRWARETA